MVTSDIQKVILPLSNGFKLVAEGSTNSDYPCEIYVGILDENGAWYQDLAIVRNAYHYNQICNPVMEEDKFEVLVYGDENGEDYTECFQIRRYQGGM